MTYADIMNQFDSLLTKQAFVPAPQSSAGKQLMQQQQQGQPGQQPPGPDAGGGGDGGPAPMAQGGIEPGQGMDQGQDPSGGQDPSAQDPSQAQGQDPSGGKEQDSQGADGRGDAPPTDLDTTTVTLRLRDVLDLVSGGKATGAALKIQSMVDDHTQKTQQKAKQNAMKDQQDQIKQQQQQQQNAMAQDGGMMSGGIYGNDPAQAGQGQPPQAPQQPPQPGMGGQ